MTKPPQLRFDAVIFATDFAHCSENAGNYASLLASHFHAELLVSHAFDLSQPALEVEAREHRKSGQRTELQAELEATAARLGRGAIRASGVLVEGDPREEMPRIAERYWPSMIAMGTHGGGRVETRILGSVAEGIMRRTSSPSLTVGPHVPVPAANAEPFRHILYATELHPLAAKSAPCAVAFAEAFGAKLDLLHVIDPQDLQSPGSLNEITRRYYNALDELVPDHGEMLRHPRDYVEVGKAHAHILRHIEEHEIDLLVLGITRNSHVGIGSRDAGAFRIIAHANCPVLTIAS